MTRFETDNLKSLSQQPSGLRKLLSSSTSWPFHLAKQDFRFISQTPSRTVVNCLRDFISKMLFWWSSGVDEASEKVCWKEILLLTRELLPSSVNWILLSPRRKLYKTFCRVFAEFHHKIAVELTVVDDNVADCTTCKPINSVSECSSSDGLWILNWPENELFGNEFYEA